MTVTKNPNGGMAPFFRALDGQVILGNRAIPEEAFLAIEADFDLLPPNPPDRPGETVIGRLYVPGRRHCLYYSDGDSLAEEGWSEVTPMPWAEGDRVLANAAKIVREAVKAGATVMDTETGQPVE